jgi:hypothetical protein
MSCSCEISHNFFDCPGRVNWQCNKGYRQPPDICGKEVADPVGKNNDRRTSVGNGPPTGHETTTERAGDQRRAEVSGENEHAFVFLACLLVSHVVSFTNCAINLDCHRLLAAFITSHKSLLLLRQLIILPTHQVFISRRNLFSSIASHGSRFRRIRDEPEGGSSSHQVHRD